MPDIVDSRAYLDRLLAAPRPGTASVLAFYDHRVGVIGTDPRLLVVPLDDHLVHRGDGVFETLKFVDRQLYQLTPHIERMARSAAAIHLSPPCSWETVADLALAVCRATTVRNGLVRLLLGRGPGGFSVDPAECPTASLYIVAYDFHPHTADWFERGVTAARTSIPAKQGYMARIKSTDYLPNALMKREVTLLGADYPVCYDDKGLVAEGATENVVLVDASGGLVVPELTNALTGTTLMRGLELARGEFPVTLTGVREADIAAAREMLLFGTTNDCVGVVRYNDTPIGDGKPGPMARLFKQRLVADLVANGLPL